MKLLTVKQTYTDPFMCHSPSLFSPLPSLSLPHLKVAPRNVSVSPSMEAKIRVLFSKSPRWVHTSRVLVPCVMCHASDDEERGGRGG